MVLPEDWNFLCVHVPSHSDKGPEYFIYSSYVLCGENQKKKKKLEHANLQIKTRKYVVLVPPTQFQALVSNMVPFLLSKTQPHISSGSRFPGYML